MLLTNNTPHFFSIGDMYIFPPEKDHWLVILNSINERMLYNIKNGKTKYIDYSWDSSVCVKLMSVFVEKANASPINFYIEDTTVNLNYGK